MEIYQRVFEFMPDGLLVVDQAGRIARANAQAARMFHYEVSELLGEPVEMLVPQPQRARHAKERARYTMNPHVRPIGSGLELNGRRKDGSEFPVDVMLSPVESDGGMQTLCVVRDITQRKREEGKFRAALESAPDAMVMVNERGAIVLVNSRTERVFGYARGDLLGKGVEMLVPERFRAERPLQRPPAGSPDAPAAGTAVELCGLRRDGTEFPVEITSNPLQTEEGAVILSAIRDISERKRAERIMDLLHEKDAMLKEIHHRVKNNLAVISSLFYLQSTYTEDENTIRLLRESQDRVRSMALVHETLYRSENLAAVDFGEYARDLSRRLVRSHRHPACAVRLKEDLQSVPMGIDRAIPCGMILNELITNSLKHAFAGRDGGEIEVSLRRGEAGTYVLRVRDDGAGVPAGVAIESAASLGLRLIRSLSRQIDGRFELNTIGNGNGTEAKLELELE